MARCAENNEEENLRDINSPHDAYGERWLRQNSLHCSPKHICQQGSAHKDT